MLYNFGEQDALGRRYKASALLPFVLAGIVNVALNLFFVIVFNMGVAGVALATVISQAISAVLVVNASLKRIQYIILI